LTPQAARQLGQLPANVQPGIRITIDALSENPRLHGVEKLSGGTSEYRIHEGDYRVISALSSNSGTGVRSIDTTFTYH
jgi:mRNA-degrading endonuclease RelE of RelBE toxin-antitoxin system